MDTQLFSAIGWSGVNKRYSRFGALANPPMCNDLPALEQKNLAQRIRDTRCATCESENDGRHLTAQEQYYDLDGQLLEQYKALPASLHRQFVHLDGQPLAMITGPAAIHYFHSDHLGAPRVPPSARGSAVWKARYDAFRCAELLVNQIK